MLFNSYLFILLFLPVCLAGYYLLQKRRFGKAGNIWLVGMSLWFYAYFNVSYLYIILTSIAVNYLLYYGMNKAQGQDRRGRARVVMVTGVLFNLGLLFYFKYFDFFVENINGVFRKDIPLRHILLPLGISFFTFQQVGFLVDAYRGETGRYSFWDYALFVTFFPQLIAGPIVTHAEMIPQFQDELRKKFNPENFMKGCYLFTLGLSKKVLLADTLGVGVNWAFSNFGRVNAAGTVVMMLSYTLQLYFDFSGYCDMARGIGKMFNIEIPINFNSPYQAADILEFWKRWHITLGRFLHNIFISPWEAAGREKSEPILMFS